MLNLTIELVDLIMVVQNLRYLKCLKKMSGTFLMTPIVFFSSVTNWYCPL
jgi:hypothetical protein